MAAKKKAVVIEQTGPEYPTETPEDLRDEEAAIRQGLIADEQRLSEIDKQYSDNLPYDRQRLINECRFYLQRTADAMLETGKRLIVLKEHEPHGEFTEALEQIGLMPRTARQMIQAAAKFSRPNARALTHLGKTKLLELMTEGDDNLEALAEGGTLAGHTLDEIDRMTSRELKAALRKARTEKEQDAEVHEKMLAGKDQKINELDKQITAGPMVPIWPELTREVQIQTQTTAFAGLQACDQLDVLREQILNGEMGEMSDEEAEPALELMAVTYHQMLVQLHARTSDLLNASEAVFEGYLLSAEERAQNAS